VATIFLKKSGDSACNPAVGGGPGAAVYPLESRARVCAGTKQPDRLGVDHSARHCWTSVSSSLGDGAAPAALVFTLDAQVGTRSLFSVCGQQRGQHARAARL